VDRLGGLNVAVQLIRERAKLGANEAVNLISYPPRRSVLEALFNASPETMAEARAERYLRSITGMRPSQALMRGGILELMPYTISVH
jgi:hypothetical protein